MWSERNLNLRQRRWIELLKDYDCTILYHPGKANVVIDALSRKGMGSLAHITEARRPLARKIHQLEGKGVTFGIQEPNLLVAYVQLKSTVVEMIKRSQGKDPSLQKIITEVKNGVESQFSIGQDVVLWFGNRLCVPDVRELRKKFLE